ncbi:hypothetical protein [Ornithinimicrobium cavernae]|uniref:hypothetical protein n=1 Tax=Ornithinimicrobium cavernae TaxID=2666047 RepID=UPI0012B172D0|nr:hypothetical protein [Ornithinimicrobium cavernae]
MNSQPSAVHLSDQARVLYRHVLRRAPATIEEHAAELGWTRTKAARQLAELESLRLIHLTEGAVIHADDPRLTLGRLLEGEEAELAARRQALIDVRVAIETYEADYRQGLLESGPRVPPWERIPASEVPSAIERLARSSRGVLRQVTSTLARGPGHLEAVRRLRAEMMAGGREQQSVFPLSVLEDPGWRQLAEARATAGERQRYLEDVPLDFIIFGDGGVLLADEDEPVVRAPDMLLVRSTNVQTMFTALFEELWRRADPVHEGGAAQADLRLLELLALGFKDEAIARHLGMGLRTVRRRVSALMDEHGVETRFQLGLAVSRRGLLK